MGPKRSRGGGSKRDGAQEVGQSSGSSGPPDAAAQAAYLAAQLAVQPIQEGQPISSAVGVPLGRTASGHSIRQRSRTSIATTQPAAAPVHYYVHPSLGTMPNIVQPRIPARMTVAALPQQSPLPPFQPPVISSLAPAPVIGLPQPASPLTSAPAGVLPVTTRRLQQLAPNAVPNPAVSLRTSSQSLPSTAAQLAAISPTQQPSSNPTPNPSNQSAIQIPSNSNLNRPSSASVMVSGHEDWYASRSPPNLPRSTANQSPPTGRLPPMPQTLSFVQPSRVTAPSIQSTAVIPSTHSAFVPISRSPQNARASLTDRHQTPLPASNPPLPQTDSRQSSSHRSLASHSTRESSQTSVQSSTLTDQADSPQTPATVLPVDSSARNPIMTPMPQVQSHAPQALSMMMGAESQWQSNQPAVSSMVQQAVQIPNAVRAIPATPSGPLPPFSWPQPSHVLTPNAVSLFANPMMQAQQPRVFPNIMDPEILAQMARQAAQNRANAVHFASPVQQVHQLPSSPPSQDARQNANPAVGLNPNAEPFQSLWNVAFPEQQQLNFPAVEAQLPPQIIRSDSISQSRPPLNINPISSHTSIMSYMPAQQPPRHPEQTGIEIQQRPLIQMPSRILRLQNQQLARNPPQPELQIVRQPPVQPQVNRERELIQFEDVVPQPGQEVIQNRPSIQPLPSQPPLIQNQPNPEGQRLTQIAAEQAQPPQTGHSAQYELQVRMAGSRYGRYFHHRHANSPVQPTEVSRPIPPSEVNAESPTAAARAAWPQTYEAFLQNLQAREAQDLQRPVTLQVLQETAKEILPAVQVPPRELIQLPRETHRSASRQSTSNACANPNAESIGARAMPQHQQTGAIAAQGAPTQSSGQRFADDPAAVGQFAGPIINQPINLPSIQMPQDTRHSTQQQFIQLPPDMRQQAAAFPQAVSQACAESNAPALQAQMAAELQTLIAPSDLYAYQMQQRHAAQQARMAAAQAQQVQPRMQPLIQLPPAIPR